MITRPITAKVTRSPLRAASAPRPGVHPNAVVSEGQLVFSEGQLVVSS